METSSISIYPWQRLVLDAWCARDEGDHPSYTTCGLSVPRQNGKNLDLEAYEVYMLAVCGAHILHTAHRVRTAKESFQRLVRHFSETVNPDLAAMVVKIRYTNGEESIELSNDGKIQFSARSRAAVRGFADVQCVVFDEAQDLTDDQLNAIMYTLAASSSGDRQMIFTGTPPDPDSPGTVFARRRLAALADPPSKRTCWHEWGITELPRSNVTFADLREDVYATNPSMGLVLSEEWTEDEFSNASLEGFARERLGWWSSDEQLIDAVIGKADWDACRIEEPCREGKVVYAVKFSPDGKRGTLAACHKAPGSKPFVYVVASRSLEHGMGWFADKLASNWRKAALIVIDGKANARGLYDRLLAAGVSKRALLLPNVSDVIAAYSRFLSAVLECEVTHWGQPALDASATCTARRQIGNGGGWGFRSTDIADSSLIEACCLAHWGVLMTKRDPDRKAVVR